MFLHSFSSYMVIPAITDVTMSALCPGQDECSLAIYLTGIQHAIMGIGTLVMMPIVGNLSDLYGRKALLTVPLSLMIVPLAILAYKRTKSFFYAYYVFKILTSMVCDGSVHCLALAYAADKVGESERASVFGVLSGIVSCAFVCGNLSTRFLSTHHTFQVSAAVAVVALIYTRIFLPESMKDENLSLNAKLIEQEDEQEDEKESNGCSKQLFKGLPSVSDMISLLNFSPAFSQAAIVAFLVCLGEVGLHTTLLYYLKARFHFDKNQFADLMVIGGIAGAASQMFLYSVAWSSWVPYVTAMFSILTVFSHPCGKAQGCISGLSSFANVISPLAFTPLTALFLSEGAPFFSLALVLCALDLSRW